MKTQISVLHDIQEIMDTCHLKELPHFEWKIVSDNRFSISLICKKKFDSKKFVYEMISKWLVPGRNISVNVFFSADLFVFDEICIVYHIEICVKNAFERDIFMRMLPTFQVEIFFGLSSLYHAKKILEIKGFTIDEKAFLIQEKISFLLHREVAGIDYDIFSEMQQFLITSPISFKEARSYLHMTKIILFLYVMKKKLQMRIEKKPEERRVLLKISRENLQFPFGLKKVAALFICMYLLKEREIFEKMHILKALQSLFPSVEIIENSYLEWFNKELNIQTYYLEIEKREGDAFSSRELRLIKEELPLLLQTNVKQLVYPLFMPRNEEEVMKNIVMISQQLKYINDVPHIIITFDEQKENALVFTVILARVLSDKTPALETINLQFPYTLEYVKRIGKIRKKYPKEIAVFRMHLSSFSFLREDFSLDLLHARQSIVAAFKNAVGELRDFNGGMLANQMEVLSEFRKSYGKSSRVGLLLENFFHSLFPTEMKCMIHTSLLKEFFQAFLSFLQKSKEKKQTMHMMIDETHFSMLFLSHVNPKMKCIYLERVHKLQISKYRLMYVDIQHNGIPYLGFLYFESQKEKQIQFYNSVVKTALSII